MSRISAFAHLSEQSASKVERNDVIEVVKTGGDGTSFTKETQTQAQSVVEFSALAENEPIMGITAETLKIPPVLYDPYPSAKPPPLDRRRKLKTISTWPAQGTDTTPTIANYNILRLIVDTLNDLNLSLGLRKFKTMRADIRISVVNTASVGTYGLLGLGWAYGPVTEFCAMSSANFYTLDVATSEGIEFVIPYLYGADSIPVNTAHPSFPANYVTLMLYNFQTWAVDGGTSVPEIEVFFSLENVVVTYYTEDNTVDVQSKEMPPSFTGHQAVTVASLGAAMLSQYFLEKNIQPNIVEVSDLVDDSEKQEFAAGSVRQAYFGNLNQPVNAHIPSLNYSQPRISPFVGNDMRMHSFKDIGRLPAIDVLHTFSSADLANTFIFPVGVAVNPAPPTDPTDNSCCASWAHYYARFFRYWRGTPRIIFHFHTSPLISMRVRISLEYPVQQSKIILPTGYTEVDDVPNEIHLIKGATRIDMSIPWLSTTPVRKTNSILAWVKIEVLNKPTKVNVNDTFVRLITTTSVDDLQFFSLQHGVEMQGAIREMHSQPPQPSFGSQSHTQVMTALDEIFHIEDIFGRYDDNQTFLGAPLLPADTFPNEPASLLTNPQNLDSQANLWQASYPFAYTTGGVQVKAWFTGATPNSIIAVRLDNLNNSANVNMANSKIQTLAEWPLLDYGIPYLCPMYYGSPTELSAVPPTYTPVRTNVEASGGAGLTKAYVRGSRDYSVLGLNVLPVWQAWHT